MSDINVNISEEEPINVVVDTSSPINVSLLTGETIDLSGLVPYTGATGNVNLGSYSLISGDWVYSIEGVYSSYIGNKKILYKDGDNTYLGDGNGRIYFNDDGYGAEVLGNMGAYYFVSSVGEGIAPYQTSSTTLNTNLNADMVDGVHATAFVPYTGATGNVDLGVYGITATTLNTQVLGRNSFYLTSDGLWITDTDTFSSKIIGLSYSTAFGNIPSLNVIPPTGTQVVKIGSGTNYYPLYANYYSSSVATGTAPYQCTSTTLNTNLNADMVDGVHASSFVPYTGATGDVDLGTHSVYNTGFAITPTAINIFDLDVGWQNLISTDGDMDYFGRGKPILLYDGEEGVYGGNFISSVATGTAPYQCTSTTVNTNLNADMVDGVHASSFVPYTGATGNVDLNNKDLSNVKLLGVGTTSPQNTAHISRTGNDAALTIQYPTNAVNEATGINFRVDTTTNNEKAKAGVFFERTTNYGRGKLHLCNDLTADGNNVAVADACLTIDESGNLSSNYDITANNLSGTNTGDQDLSGLVPYTGATGAVNLGANNLTIDTNVLFVDASSNEVGIGTATPNARLEVLSPDNSPATNIMQFTSNNGAVGVGFWYGGIRPFGSDANLGLALSAKGSGSVYSDSRFEVVNSYSILYGLRIGGGDTNNTIYQENNIGITNAGGAKGLHILQAGGCYYEGGDFTARSNLKIGYGAAGVDYTLTFDGETNDGVITWMEDEDYFLFADTIVTPQLRLSALNTAPTNASAAGTLGEVRIDENHIYVCTATNTWKRAAIATWE